MKKKSILLFLFVCMTVTSAQAQDFFQYFEVIKPRHKVIGVKYVQNDTTLLKGDTLRANFDSRLAWGEYELLTKEIILDEDLRTTYKKVVIDTMEWYKKDCLMPGRAKLYQSEDQENRLVLNWSVNQYGKDYYSDYQEYYIDLENRGKSEWFFFRGPVAGAVTIPFKYRGKINSVASTITTDLNASLSLGYSIGYSRYNYRKYGGINNTKYSLSVLAVAGPSVVTLTSSNTSLTDEPLAEDESRGFGVLSLGGGLVLGVKNFSMGIFMGKDLAFGRDRKLWNYHNEWWTGYGFGYNIGLSAVLQALKFGS